MIGAAIAWAVAVGFGARAIYGYSTEPGAQHAAPPTWPEASQLAAPDGRGRIVMFVHPECPCTRASLVELAAITRHERAAGWLIEVVSDGTGASWTQAGEIPGVTRTIDREGHEATRFGARTSGHVVVYDAFGRQRYGGGITGSRGHEGENVGRNTVEAILEGTAATDLTHVVFGCAL